MEFIWFIIIITLSIKALYNLLLQAPKRLLPPKSQKKYGPIITLSIGHSKSIFIRNSSLAHQAFIQNGAVFADRPTATETSKIFSSNQHNITSASYGPLWRLLRRNLTFQILHSSKIKSFSPARKWGLNIIKKRLKRTESKTGEYPSSPVLVADHFQFGTDTTSTALQWVMANLVKYQDIQSKLFDEIRKISDNSDDEIEEEDLKKLPYLKAVILEGLRRHPPAHFVLPHGVTQDVELDGYVTPKEATVNVMVAEIGWDPKVWGEDSMEFKPERFLNEDGNLDDELSDVTGNKEIKMIPFGAGRRMCPAFGLGILILEYFVANFIKEFKWTAKVGDDIDLSEKQEFTIVMKNPLWAHVSPREEEEED
ncbi:hypothetical protein MKX01_004413 [Papaver californicum]|nr:hypothetical protein MKX01_004413 [Papaver californicum]